jgi:hypothetical protein
LQQTAGRRAVLRDRDAFPVFVDALRAIEPAVTRTLDRIARTLDEQTADRLNDVVRRIFGRVLRELADLDNPMRTPVGSEPGEGALLDVLPASTKGSTDGPRHAGECDADTDLPDLGELVPPAAPDPDPGGPEPEARPDRRRARSLPSLARDPEPTDARSRFDEELGVVVYNDHHADYLLVKDDEAALLDYLAALVAKEYVVYNNPRSAGEDLAEEMVPMLVRVRRHMPKRR